MEIGIRAVWLGSVPLLSSDVTFILKTFGFFSFRDSNRPLYSRMFGKIILSDLFGVQARLGPIL